VAKTDRFHDKAGKELNDAVDQFNVLNPGGVQQVKCWVFDSDWRKIQSLSRGECYFYNSKTRETLNFGDEPDEVKGKDPLDVQYQDSGSNFTKPPSKDCYHEQSLRNALVSGIITNAYKVEGEAFSNKVHEYFVEFEPPLKTDQILLRRATLMGTNSRTKARNIQLLNDHFGYWAFDNFKFFSMGVPAHKPGVNVAGKHSLRLNDEHVVMFRYNQTIYLDHDDIPVTEEEQLLNTFKKRSLKQAGFNNVRDSWFYKDSANPPHASMKPIRVQDRVTVLNGFVASIHITPSTKDKDKVGVFKADLSNKLVSTTNVNEIVFRILANYQNNPRDPAFRSDVNAQLKGKFFIMRYNNQSIRIETIDFDENENATFECGAEKLKISYKKYVENKYGMKCGKKEVCVLKDRRGSAFLPQLAYLTMRSDECADVYEHVLEVTNQPIHVRLQRIDSLVTHLNASEDKAVKERQKLELDKKKKAKADAQSPQQEAAKQQPAKPSPSPNAAGDDDDDKKDEEETEMKLPQKSLNVAFKINPSSIQTDALRLHYPDFIYKAFGNGRNLVDKRVNMGDGITWGGREGTKGFLGEVHQIKQWCIVGDERSIDQVYGHWEAYCGMRGFDRRNGPILEPEAVTIDYRRGDEAYVDIGRKGYQLILLVLPSGEFGSEVKARFTKAVQSQRMIGSKKKGALVQCIRSENARNKNAVLGAFEDSMAKIGNIMYRVVPHLSADSVYAKALAAGKIWTIGLDVSHTTAKTGGKPSAAMLVLQTLPFDGTHRGMSCIAHLNKAREEIIPFAAMVTMTYQALRRHIGELKDAKRRPEIIMVFRDGLPDNGLKDAHSKEVVGIQRAIRIMRAELEEKHKVKWKPKMQFIVVSKSPVEKFGVYDDRAQMVQPLNFPAVVFRGITSSKLWDFFMWNYHPNKARKIHNIKPLRYVVLKDELKLGQSKRTNQPVALFEIINTLFYTYCFSIPFPLGGTSQPGPIVYAKHYAETFSQMILSSDRNLRDMSVAGNLTSRPHVICSLYNLPDIANVQQSPPNNANQRPQVPPKNAANAVQSK